MNHNLLCILLFFFLSSTSLEASCISGYGSTNNHYIISDFVGIVKIKEVYDTPSEEASYYKIEVEEQKVFKGKTPSTLKVMGNRDVFAFHNTFVSEGEVWLVYAFEEKDGKYYFGSCSSPDAKRLQTNEDAKRKVSERLQKELDQLELFKKKVPNLDRDYTIIEGELDLFDYLDKYNGQIFKKSFAQYLITLNSDLSIKKVKVLRGLSPEFDQKITAFLKNQSSWKAYIEPGRPEININTENDRHIVGVYYFHEKRRLFPRIYVGFN